MKWLNDTSTPYRPQANGVAERAVGRAIDGTRSLLFASGFGNRWWDDALVTYCYTRNITDTVTQHPSSHVANKTAYELRHGVAFHGHKIPFGASIRYMPESKRKEGEASGSKLRKFDPRTKKGIFMGYHIPPGGYGTATTECWILKHALKQKAPTTSDPSEYERSSLKNG